MDGMIREVLKKEVYDIPTPSSLTIGDGLYLEDIEKLPKNKTKNLRSLVFIKEKIPAVRKAKLVYKEVLYKLKETDNLYKVCPNGIRNVEAKIIVSNKEYIDTYVDDLYYPDAVKSEYDLGCDTASFNIIVGHKDGIRDAKIHTGADGYYGDVADCYVPFGFQVTLCFDMQLGCIEESELRALLAYLFKCDAIAK